VCCSLQATAPVKLQVEEALNKGVGSFQELLQQQKETLRSLQQDYSSYAEQASVHPSVVVAQRESAARSSEANERLNHGRGIMRQVTNAGQVRKSSGLPHVTQNLFLISGLQSRAHIIHKPRAHLST
jgi:hypothetical protein